MSDDPAEPTETEEQPTMLLGTAYWLGDLNCGCIALGVELPDGAVAAVHIGKDAAREFLSELLTQMNERKWLGDS